MQRFVRTGPRSWRPDEGRRKQPGRGTYLCSQACAHSVEKNRKFPGLAASADEYGFKLGYDMKTTC